MKATDAKIRRILEKDYSDAVIRKGQEWYVGDEVFLECDETKDLLLYQMSYCKEAVEYAWLLHDVIADELGRYKVTDNLFESVLELGEILSIIEIYAGEFLDAYRKMEDSETTVHTGRIDTGNQENEYRSKTAKKSCRCTPTEN